jgi:2-keto-4-pentenoate hydratase/2-oxohepta-3-ene-1,7-dioic acid hydratase in catechol pathway
MKFATVSHAGARIVALVDPDSQRLRVLDVVDMVDLIERYGQLKSHLPFRTGPDLSLDQVTLCAPIPHPARNVFCVGKNYRAHAAEFTGSGYDAGVTQGAPVDDYPAVFTKPASAVVATGVTVSLHPGVTAEVDYEGELAVIIGSGGCNIDRAEAMHHVWGYTILNDVTARDRQKQHRQWFLGKGLDGFCPMGPWIVTADELDGADIRLQTRVNGALRQDASTRDLIFTIPEIIAAISAGMTLAPGDVIATGTPAGVGIGFAPPRFLRAGDQVAITVSGIGTLTNSFA